MALTIDQLEIQIEAESTKATDALDNLIAKLGDVRSKLNGLGGAGKKAGTGLQKTADGATKSASAIEKQANSTNKASKSTKSFTDKLAQQISKYHTLMGAFKSAAQTMGSWFNESNEYIETLNLFNVTMGEGADEAYKYAESVQKLIGIDIKDWMQYQGVFKNLTSGFGVASKDANIMSQNLTQLSYDMASFFNTDVETAFDKLSSAMSGQVKGLREFGIDTTVASLQEYALAKGIDVKVRSMTQAEKSMLRYNYIMEKSIIMQGDMARTLVTPANALRILSAQLTQMKRALGNIISVLVAQFIPYIQAMVEIITDAANAIAKFFNFKLPKIDYSSLGGNIAGGFEDAEESANGVADAAKKIKKQLMGFDELNIITNPDADSDASGGGAGAGGALGGMEPLGYDFLKGLKTEKIDEIKEKMKKILVTVGLISAGLAAWKISTSFATGLNSIVTALNIIKASPIIAFFGKIGFAIQAVAGGAATFGEAITYVFGGVAGIFSGIILAITGVIGYVKNLVDMLKNGESVSNILGAALGGLAGAAGAFLIAIGVGATVATGGIAALVVAIVAAVGIITALVINNWEEIKTALGTAWDWLYKTVIKPIGDFFSGVATWFYDNVIKPIVDFFAPIFTAIFEMIVLIYSKIKEIVTGIITAIGSIFKKIGEIFLKIVEIFVALGKAAYTYVIKPIIDFAVSIAKKVYDAAIKPIIDFFVSLGKKAYEYIIKPIFDKIVWLKDKAVELFKTVGTFVVNFVSNAFKSVINGVLSGVEWTINGFIRMLNGAINIINKIPGVSITKVTELSIPRLAEGGIVSEGQMFIAREAGPELVGSIGRKTTVANNDQIISGIESGVYRAMVAANSNNGGSHTIRIINEIDGDVVGEKVIQYHNGRVIQTGVSPLLV